MKKKSKKKQSHAFNLKGKAFKDKGVNYREKVRGECISRYWIATYVHPKKGQIRKQFSVDKYGPRKSKKLAQKFRDDGIAKKTLHAKR